MSEDKTFDHTPTEEELAAAAAAEADAELARRIRAEVLRVQSGEGMSDEERAEAEADVAEERERVSMAIAEEAEQKRQKDEEEERAKSNIWVALMSGRIFLHEGVVKYYSHLLLIAVLTFVSIFVMFWSLGIDMKHSAMDHEVQLLRERSIRLRELSYSRSSHSAVVKELERRGIGLKDARTPSMMIK